MFVKVPDGDSKLLTFQLITIGQNLADLRWPALELPNKLSLPFRILIFGVEKAPRVGSLLFPSRPALLSQNSPE
jgi:hypothetical protein